MNMAGPAGANPELSFENKAKLLDGEVGWDARGQMEIVASGPGRYPGDRSMRVRFIEKGKSFGVKLSDPGADPQALRDHVADRLGLPWDSGLRVLSGSRRKSKFFSAAEPAGKPVPERVWLVYDLIPGRTVTLFSGDGGSGKSLLTLQLADAAAAGCAWLARAVKQGRAMLCSADDDEEQLHRRLDAIRAAEGLSWSDLSGLTIRSLAGEDALLAHESTPSRGPLRGDQRRGLDGRARRPSAATE